MKNEAIRVTSSVVSDTIFLFFYIHLLALRRPKFLLLLQKILAAECAGVDGFFLNMSCFHMSSALLD